MLLQILLTVFACIRGWKLVSLIPISIAYLLGILILLTGIDNSISLVFDILTIIILIIMCIIKPKKIKN